MRLYIILIFLSYRSRVQRTCMVLGQISIILWDRFLVCEHAHGNLLIDFQCGHLGNLPCTLLVPCCPSSWKLMHLYIHNFQCCKLFVYKNGKLVETSYFLAVPDDDSPPNLSCLLENLAGLAIGLVLEAIPWPSDLLQVLGPGLLVDI